MKCHHVGLVYSTHNACRDDLFKFTEILQGHDLLIDRMDPAVIAHAFNIDDLIEHDLLQTVFGFDEDEFRRRISSAMDYVVLCFIDRLQEAVEREGF